MKIKKPEIIPMFKCSVGPPVETLPMWQKSELEALLREAPDTTHPNTVANFMLENSDRFVAILALKEKGRQNGAGDKVKRKPRTPKPAEPAAAKAA